MMDWPHVWLCVGTRNPMCDVDLTPFSVCDDRFDHICVCDVSLTAFCVVGIVPICVCVMMLINLTGFLCVMSDRLHLRVILAWTHFVCGVQLTVFVTHRATHTYTRACTYTNSYQHTNHSYLPSRLTVVVTVWKMSFVSLPVQLWDTCFCRRRRPHVLEIGLRIFDKCSPRWGCRPMSFTRQPCPMTSLCGR